MPGYLDKTAHAGLGAEYNSALGMGLTAQLDVHFLRLPELALIPRIGAYANGELRGEKRFLYTEDSSYGGSRDTDYYFTGAARMARRSRSIPSCSCVRRWAKCCEWASCLTSA